MRSVEEVMEIFREGDESNRLERAERHVELQNLLDNELVWDFYPVFQQISNNNDDQVLSALEEYIQDLWNESLKCYIGGDFYACIALLSFTLEAALKRELREHVNYTRDTTLRDCITLCQDNGILPNDDNHDVIIEARYVNTIRNDIAHANIPRQRSESILDSEGDEHQVVDIAPGIQSVEQFKNSARACIQSMRLVLEYIY